MNLFPSSLSGSPGCFRDFLRCHIAFQNIGTPRVFLSRNITSVKKKNQYALSGEVDVPDQKKLVAKVAEVLGAFNVIINKMKGRNEI